MNFDLNYYMHYALKQAEKAFTIDEVPIGAVVVDGKGTIIGRGYNQVERKHQQNAHAEIIAINKACKKVGNWRLQGCWLFVTLEPCTMCIGLIRLSRITKVVFGAPSKLFGYRLDKEGLISLYKRDVTIVEGILADKSVLLLKNFFKEKRK